jgi:hypothetical protein
MVQEERETALKPQKIGLWSLIGITLQVTLLLGLAYWVVQSKAIDYYDGPHTVTVNGCQLSPAEVEAWRREGFGPPMGWQLFDVPIEVFEPQLWAVVVVLVGTYLAMITVGLWKHRWLAIGWWLLPCSLAPVAFFALALLTKPIIFY